MLTLAAGDPRSLRRRVVHSPRVATRRLDPRTDHLRLKGTPVMTNLRLAIAFASLFLLGTCLLLVGAIVRGSVEGALPLV
jgi:hypothetical protein